MVNKFMKAMTRLHRDDRGMTGLETAIILIAFVTVAAVFGYAVLSAGLFSAERSKETIFAGLQQAKSNMDISGSVVAMSDENATKVASILVTVKNAIAGNPIDMTPCTGEAGSQNKVVISLTTAKDYFANIKWTALPIGAANTNNLMEVGEQFQITVDLADLGNGYTLSQDMVANDTFSLQLKPSMGSTITVMRTLPPALDAVMDLH